MEPEQAAFILVIGAVVAGFVFAPSINERIAGPSGGGGTADGVGDPGSAHIHAQLYFTVNGSETWLDVPSDSVRGSARTHFHGNDSVLHVHATDVDLGFALERLGVGINRSCLAFRPEGERFCSDAGVVGVMVNGEAMAVEDALKHRIHQEDNIIVWFLEEPEAGAFEGELPPEYREQVPGNSI